MYSDTPNKTQLQQIRLEVTQAKLDKIAEGYTPMIRDGTLELDVSDKITYKQTIEKLKDDLKKATKVEDLIKIIETLI